MKTRGAAFGCGLLLLAVGSAFSQQILWQFTNDVPQSRFSGSPAVGDDGTIYIGTSGAFTNGLALLAISPAGAKRWAFTTDVSITTSPTIGTNRTIYFGTENGRLIALDDHGSLQWEYQTGNGGVRGLALGYDGTIYGKARIYVGTNRMERSKLVALNTDGAKKWEFTVAEPSAIGSPVINFDGTIYFSTSRSFYALNPDGTVYWRFPAGGAGAAIGADGTIYANGYALNPDGTVEWLARRGNPIVGPDGTLYINGNVAFSRYGLKLWEDGDYNDSTVISVDNTLYALENVWALLIAIDPNGVGKWWLTLPSSDFGSLALSANGALYVGGDDRLYAIKVPYGPAKGGWPMEGHDLKRTGRAGFGSPARPCLSALRLAQGRGFQFTMVGEIGVNYRIETSPDLSAWTPLTNFVCANLVTHFTDSTATNFQRRFYRALSP